MRRGEHTNDAGVRAQVETAYAEWGGHLLRFALRLCGSRDDAEDIVVETYAEAYQKWYSFKGNSSRLNWLYGIAVNRHRMNRRKDRSRHWPLDDDISERTPNIVDRIAVEQALAEMPLAWRESFLLVRCERLTTREAAAILARPHGTVLYQVYRAVHFIRGQFQEELDAAGTAMNVEVRHEL